MTQVAKLASEDRKLNNTFSFFILMVSLFSLFFLFVPVLHLYGYRLYGDKADIFVRQVGVDSLSMLIGLLGFFTVMALVRLHRRLSAIEKAILSGETG